ncbi:MAG TPA: serine/threonine-protein kinase [Gemmatimonadaceae bacterium]|nr:serine/threonine-protein kinase [Gemmatimonadaceae bacterium]
MHRHSSVIPEQDVASRLQDALGEAYRIERELGGGGMSRIFLAREVALGRQVVVKLLPPEYAAGVNGERFHREILVAARLQHPHIVPILSAGEMRGVPYYTMPFIEGESLRARLLRGERFRIAEVTRILHDVIDALAYAHEHGVVHRDIKPDNVLMSRQHAVISDFGVAKALCAAHDGSCPACDGVAGLERGLAIGTPAYMAPEQAAADPSTDHRADIYGFGVLAFELLTGRPPFDRREPLELLAAHVAERPIPVGALRDDVPARLAALIMRCLEKQPEARPATAAEVRDALDAMSTSGEYVAASPSLSFAARVSRLAAAVALAALGAGATLAALASERGSQPVIADDSAARPSPVMLGPGLADARWAGPRRTKELTLPPVAANEPAGASSAGKRAAAVKPRSTAPQIAAAGSATAAKAAEGALVLGDVRISDDMRVVVRSRHGTATGSGSAANGSEAIRARAQRLALLEGMLGAIDPEAAALPPVIESVELHRDADGVTATVHVRPSAPPAAPRRPAPVPAAGKPAPKAPSGVERTGAILTAPVVGVAEQVDQVEAALVRADRALKASSECIEQKVREALARTGRATS